MGIGGGHPGGVVGRGKSRQTNKQHHGLQNKSQARSIRYEHAGYSGDGDAGSGGEYHAGKREARRPQAGKTKAAPPTISVMFVEKTKGGVLAKLLQEAEDGMAHMTGFRIRMTEMSGSKLCHLLPNTNPWSGVQCGRQKCTPCAQGEEKIED